MSIQKDHKICITYLKLRYSFSGELFSDDNTQMSLVHSEDPESLGDKCVPEFSANFQLFLKIMDVVIS